MMGSSGCTAWANRSPPRGSAQRFSNIASGNQWCAGSWRSGGWNKSQWHSARNEAARAKEGDFLKRMCREESTGTPYLRPRTALRLSSIPSCPSPSRPKHHARLHSSVSCCTHDLSRLALTIRISFLHLVVVIRARLFVRLLCSAPA